MRTWLLSAVTWELTQQLLLRVLAPGRVLELGWVSPRGCKEGHTLVTIPYPLPRNSCAKDLTSFAAEAIAMNRQLAQCEEDTRQDQPVVIRATSRCLQLSPPSQSKLAQRRQRASLSSTPMVLVGDRA